MTAARRIADIQLTDWHAPTQTLIATSHMTAMARQFQSNKLAPFDSSAYCASFPKRPFVMAITCNTFNFLEMRLTGFP
jgi:hypothetical protein